MWDVDLGKKIQAYRQIRKISSRELSRMAEISPSMLSQIENAQVNPSLNTLKAIAQALDIPLYRFFQESERQAASPVVRCAERKRISYPEKREIQYEVLTPDDKGSIDFCMMHIAPGKATSEKMFFHKGEEVACVISGQARIVFEDACYTLEEGDSVRIAPEKPHRWENTADRVATVVFALGTVAL